MYQGAVAAHGCPVFPLVSFRKDLAMFKAAAGDTVKVHYTGKLTDGTLFDTSMDKEPLQFIIGKHEVIAGFEEAVTGMVMGEKKTVVIPPEKAYGQPKAEALEQVERKDLPADLALKVGGQLEITRHDNTAFYVMITELTDTHVTLDANHPLAGKDLVFDIELLEIQQKKK